MTGHDDLRMTRELCRKPGVLAQHMQEAYRVVRDGVETVIPLDHLSRNELTVIVEELRCQAEKEMADAEAIMWTIPASGPVQ